MQLNHLIRCMFCRGAPMCAPALFPPLLAAEGVTVFKDEVGKEQEKGQYKYEMG